MPGFLRVLLKILDSISIYSGRLFAYLSLPVIAVIMLEVIGRYFFRHPFLWSHETMTFLSAGVYMLGGGYVLYQRGHISVDIVVKNFSLRGQAIINVVASAFFFLYILVLANTVFQYTVSSFNILEKSGTPWNPPLYPLKLGLLIAVILIFLAGIGNLIRDLYTVITGKESQESGPQY